MKRYILFCIVFLMSSVAFAQTISITSGATWSIPTLTSTITSAGKNYEHIETSGPSQTLIKVNSALVWSVSVQQITGSSWHSNLVVSVRRTGDGTGGAIMLGTSNYLILTATNQAFFSGLLGLGFSRDNVPIQYKIEGLSVTLPVKTYTTTIQYTVTGL